MKQKNKVITDINISKIKQLFVYFFVYFLCIVFLTHFNPFPSKKSFTPVEIKCLE